MNTSPQETEPSLAETSAAHTQATESATGEARGRSEPSPRENGDEPSAIEFVIFLLRQRRRIVSLPIAAVVATMIVSLFVPPTYTATTTFVAEAGSNSRLPAGLAGLAGLAGQFGTALLSDASQSPQFYADLIKSRELMERVVSDRYPLPSTRTEKEDSATLLEIFGLGGKDRSDTLYRGVKKLRKLVSTSVDRRTNVVQLSVDAHNPMLAALVANRIVVYLNEFNAQTRESQARERRRFAEDRLAQADSELRGAEDHLKTFYQRNRSWQQAPQLVFEEGQLRRQVDIRQEVYLTLRREYETARIDEANDTPVLTVIDAAVPPTRRSEPNRVLWAIVAAFLGTMTGVAWAFAADQADRFRRQEDESSRELRALVGDIFSDLRRIMPKSKKLRGDIDPAHTDN
jgi:uncharacterized protein involved in exopolysaccharide biosynthesis